MTHFWAAICYCIWVFIQIPICFLLSSWDRYISTAWKEATTTKIIISLFRWATFFTNKAWVTKSEHLFITTKTGVLLSLLLYEITLFFLTGRHRHSQKRCVAMGKLWKIISNSGYFKLASFILVKVNCFWLIVPLMCLILTYSIMSPQGSPSTHVEQNCFSIRCSATFNCAATANVSKLKCLS